MVWHYAEKGFPYVSYLTLTMGYYVSFGIILLVPIDMACIIFDRRTTSVGSDPIYDANIESLSAAYSFFFNVIIVFGFTLVFEEYYNTDGYFTVLSRLWSALTRMIYDTIVMVVAGVIILIILIKKNVVQNSSTAALQLTAVIVTNTLYESFLMFLLGYGLVEFPRNIWREADIEHNLKQTQQKAASDFKDIGDAHFNISVQVANAVKTKHVMSESGDAPELTAAMDIILAECPPDIRAYRVGDAAVDKKGKVTLSTLGKLRTDLKTHVSQYRMAQAKVESTKLNAYAYEDLLDAIQRNDKANPKYDGVEAINWSLTGKPSSRWEYKWQLKIKPLLLRISALLIAVMSIFSFIGVACSISTVDPKYSIYNTAVENPQATMGGIVVFIFFTLGYVVYVTFWALFQLKFAGLMDLVPGKTTPNSLSFNVRMCSKLAAPLVFFYLGWIYENGLAPSSSSRAYNNAPTVIIDGVEVDQSIPMPSAFSHFYQLQNVAIIKQTFGTVFPVMCFSFTFLSVTNIYNWICVKLGMTNWQFGTPVLTEEQLSEGIKQLTKSKKTTLNEARRARFRNRLLRMMNMQGDADVDEDGNPIAASAKEANTGWFSWLFKSPLAGANKSPGSGRASPATVIEEPKIVAPDPCGGMLHVMGGTLRTTWTEHFAEVRAPGLLHVFENRKAADEDKRPKDFPEGINLLSVLDFKVPVANQLVLYLTNKTHTFKFANPADAESWKNKLQEWKNFNKVHGADYMRQQERLQNDELNDIFINIADTESDTGSQTNTAKGKPAATKGKADPIPKSGSKDGLSNSRVNSFESITKSASNSKDQTNSKNASMFLGEDIPDKLDGFLELKGHGRFGAEDWQRLYARVDGKTYKLVLSKTATPNETPVQSISVPTISDVEYYDHKGKVDHKRFNFSAEGKVFKFRVQSEMDGKKWVDGLNGWKDYFLLNLTA